MKMLLIIYEAGIDEDLQGVIERLEVSGWTKLAGATGTGHRGNRFGTQIWPGTNNLLLVALPEDQVPGIVGELNELKSSYLKPPALQIFVLPVDTDGGPSSAKR